MINVRSIGKKHIIFIISGFFVILSILILCSFVFKDDFRIKDFNETININYGEDFSVKPGDICYGSLFSCSNVAYIYEGNVDTNNLGSYEIIYKYKYKEKELSLKQTVNVIDSIEPVIEVKSDFVKACPNGKTDSVIIASDNYDGDISNKIVRRIEDNKLVIEVTDSSGNKASKVTDVEVVDDEGPVITIKGDNPEYVPLGSNFIDDGATVIDNCDNDLEIVAQNEVNTSITGTYNVIYTARDKKGNETIVKRIVYVRNPIPVDRNPSGEKIVYLTFDDGPSAYTGQLLDVLKKYNVKATFFVTGNGSDDMILREYQEGHTVALHTNSHDYGYVYSSVDNYFNDLATIQARVERITGVKSKLIRFPGGSSNTVSRSVDGGTKIMSYLTKEVQNRGYHYFDWNVSSGDAGNTTDTNQVYLNVVNNLKSGYSIVLQHDSKGYSVAAVEKIIQFCNKNGYTFKTLNENSPGAHHGVNN